MAQSTLLATDSTSGTVRARCLARVHLDPQLGGAGDRTSNLSASKTNIWDLGSFWIYLQQELPEPAQLGVQLFVVVFQDLHARLQAGLVLSEDPRLGQ